MVSSYRPEQFTRQICETVVADGHVTIETDGAFQQISTANKKILHNTLYRLSGNVKFYMEVPAEVYFPQIEPAMTLTRGDLTFQLRIAKGGFASYGGWKYYYLTDEETDAQAEDPDWDDTNKEMKRTFALDITTFDVTNNNDEKCGRVHGCNLSDYTSVGKNVPKAHLEAVKDLYAKYQSSTQDTMPVETENVYFTHDRKECKMLIWKYERGSERTAREKTEIIKRVFGNE